MLCLIYCRSHHFLQFIENVTVATLNAVMGLTRSWKNYWQMLDANLPVVISPYCTSPLLRVALAAKLSLSHLIHLLEPKILQYLTMSELIASKLEVADFLFNTTTESLHLLNVLSYISLLMDDDVTACSITSKPKVLCPVLKVISDTLQLSKDYAPEIEAAIFASWKLALKGVSFSDEDELLAQILSIGGGSVASVQILAKCASWKLADGSLEGRNSWLLHLLCETFWMLCRHMF